MCKEDFRQFITITILIFTLVFGFVVGCDMIEDLSQKEKLKNGFIYLKGWYPYSILKDK